MARRNPASVAAARPLAGTCGVSSDTEPPSAPSLVKSKDRVKDLAEVFTPAEVVEEMLTLVAEQSKAGGHDCVSHCVWARPLRRRLKLRTDVQLNDVTGCPSARFLEPACGNGNFLQAILARKLTTVARIRAHQPRFEFLTLLAVTSVYGIDIDPQNVEEARERLRSTVRSHYSGSRQGSALSRSPGFDAALDHVLQTNVVLGDSLNGANAIELVEYTISGPARHFTQSHYTLADLVNAGPRDGALPLPPTPARRVGPLHYLELASFESRGSGR